MAEIQTIIGSLPVLRGEYDGDTSYYRDNQVTMFGSTFQSVADDNVGNPPAEERDDGKVYAINTDKWIIVANALGAYNAGSRIDKLAENTEIKNEEGKTIKTPFREIESPEFLHCIVDAEDRFLFGIQLDGSIEWGKGIPAPIRTKLQEIITQCQQDKTDLLGAINTINGILDKTSIKDEAGEIQDTPFRIIENEEFLWAVVDSEDRVLFGFYRATGEPYYPLNEMYHVEQNEEFFALWLDAANHVLLGIRRDGEIIGEINAVNALKQVVSQVQSDLASLQEKVGAIDNLKELLDVFSMQENPEYLAAETDADGKVLSATYNDGSHYSHNLKSETIPEEFSHIEDQEGRMEITTDAEGRVLAERKKDGERYEHKMAINNLKVSNLNLQGNSVNNIKDALKANGFDVKTPTDWSEDDFVQIPIPRCAKLNLITDKMPTAKSGMGTSGVNCDIPCNAEFWDMQGNYFKIPILLSAQGNSSMMFPKKNLAIDMFTDESRENSYTVKFGDWVSQDSYHLKAYYTDFFRGVGAVSYMLYEEMAKTRDIGDMRPYEKAFADKWVGTTDNYAGPFEDLDKNIGTGAKCFPQGFPVIVYQNGVFYGVYSWQLKKHRDNMFQDKKSAKHIHLDGTLNAATIWGGTINWTQFEVRNPKSLYMQEKQTIRGEQTIKYNGDYPHEIMGDDSEEYDSGNKDMKRCATVKKYIVALSGRLNELKQAETDGKSETEIKTLIEKYFNVPFLIDYILETNLVRDYDGYGKNWQWTTYDGILWTVNPYDHDGAFGANHIGTSSMKPYEGWIGESLSLPSGWIIKYYLPELKARWKELRDIAVFDAKHITNLLYEWCSRIGYDNWKSEYEKWNESPCNRPNLVNVTYWTIYTGFVNSWSATTVYSKNSIVSWKGSCYKSLLANNIGNTPSAEDTTNWEDVTYNPQKNYDVGDTCWYGKSLFYGFKCTKACVNEAPITGFYESYPYEMGHFDSIYRVEKWLEQLITFEDKKLEYNK